MFAKLFELRNKKLKDNKKKGFTLVELIVVLVILAILAALLIPALTGYIKKAKEKSIVAETRQVVMAAQTIADEQYGTISLKGAGSVTITLGDKTGTTDDKETSSTITITAKDIAELAEVSAENIKTVTGKDGKITKVVYENDGKQCTYQLEGNDTDGYDLTSKGTYTVK
ncbi:MULTISPECIES: prepilin-type N-terminal cleavage/methylation domain-containing protein [Clostridia]|uniref:prepilin-type N-terminal cleavage/methylation domain-containing protein n=1 Tax=Clostridia TaxID=186801 RepID=UPI000E4A6102|nr:MULTISPECIES: prepilin-type N-terminal cleavage/methylation domain-containing protein [Clostridia]RHV71124.1 prepilin-type N-terminal cleavage/methylation domain-containing protein [Roseburia sp. OM02-15]